jgi:hypothetical protein
MVTCCCLMPRQQTQTSVAWDALRQTRLRAVVASGWNAIVALLLTLTFSGAPIALVVRSGD